VECRRGRDQQTVGRDSDRSDDTSRIVREPAEQPVEVLRVDADFRCGRAHRWISSSRSWPMGGRPDRPDVSATALARPTTNESKTVRGGVPSYPDGSVPFPPGPADGRVCEPAGGAARRTLPFCCGTCVGSAGGNEPLDPGGGAGVGGPGTPGG